MSELISAVVSRFNDPTHRVPVDKLGSFPVAFVIPKNPCNDEQTVVGRWVNDDEGLPVMQLGWGGGGTVYTSGLLDLGCEKLSNCNIIATELRFSQVFGYLPNGGSERLREIRAMSSIIATIAKLRETQPVCSGQ